MPVVTIDRRRVTVDAGTTILAAAEKLGIRIPTLCHVRGLEPVSSCFVCAVQIEGRRQLSPACAMPVSDGMVIATDTEDVRAARRMAIELLLSDHAGECVAPCSARCPAGLDIPGFVFNVAGGDPAGAMEVISERLALPGSLGRICPRLCEQQCHRCDHDYGLAIGPLHRYAADHAPYIPARAALSGKSVAIVGAGPAGLACAYFLLRKGHRATLFDAKPEGGGMLRYGVPAFRLPKDALDAEIASVRELGAELRMGLRWGVDFALKNLRHQYDAVFLGIGAQRSQLLRCDGEDLALPALDLLEAVVKGRPPSLGDDVIVIGGGNTAIDCARTAVRLGARSVRILYRRTEAEMPCIMSEVDAARAEGVRIEFLVAPVRIAGDNGSGFALACRLMQLGDPDESGRRRPVPVKGSEFTIACSAVIAAIGQSVDRALAEREGLRVTQWGIEADPRTLATNLAGVFAGGDGVLGADLAVRAVAAGRIAAASIDQYLRGEPVIGEPAMAGVKLEPVDDRERAEIFRAIEKASAVRMPEIAMERRVTTFDEVEAGLADADAEREARRCMTCGCRKAANCRIRALATEYEADPVRFGGARRRFTQDLSHPDIVYEPGKCILCNACVRIASEAGEKVGVATIGRGFEVAIGAPFGSPFADALSISWKRCAEACPTAAIALRTPRSCDLVRMSVAATP